ncbi:MAG: patatin-like phospholipase family protein [Cytophagaceae bacterium]|nr:patatin-like phospholipase family protein [Cytophagaceae bacterium]
MPLSLQAHLSGPGPKRILALDGGGIRGALTVGFLEKIEDILCKRHGDDPDFRLCHYFDLIGGTSTGAIIATCLAMGMKASEVKKLYLELGGVIFSKRRTWFQWLSAKFDSGSLEESLKDVLGNRTLGSADLHTGLCIVTKRADTGSTWPLINHPGGTYFEFNKGILLRNAVRASAAAPTYFTPEIIDVGKGELAAFIDGGVSMYNNPALLLFLVSTLKGFPFRWASGGEELMIVSVGTGWSRTRVLPSQVTDNRLWNWGVEVPDILMRDASLQGHILLQYLSNSPTRTLIDSEIGDMKADLLGGKAHLHYLRYNVRMETNELNDLGFSNMDLKTLVEMSNAGNRKILAQIGEKAASQFVKEAHFPTAFDLPV